MATTEQVRYALKTALKDLSPKFCKVCTVKNVSADTATGLMICDVVSIEDNTIIEDVRLCADFQQTSTDAGLILVPTLGSIVIVSFLGDAEAYVSMVSVVDKIFLNGNEYGGLVEVINLVTKLNALENTLNAFINDYDKHTHTGPFAGTTATPIPVGPAIISPITQQSDLENITVKHGAGVFIPGN